METDGVSDTRMHSLRIGAQSSRLLSRLPSHNIRQVAVTHGLVSVGRQLIHDFTASIQDEVVIVARVSMHHSASEPEQGFCCTESFAYPMTDVDAHFLSFGTTDPGVGATVVPFRVGN